MLRCLDAVIMRDLVVVVEMELGGSLHFEGGGGSSGGGSVDMNGDCSVSIVSLGGGGEATFSGWLCVCVWDFVVQIACSFFFFPYISIYPCRRHGRPGD